MNTVAVKNTAVACTAVMKVDNRATAPKARCQSKNWCENGFELVRRGDWRLQPPHKCPLSGTVQRLCIWQLEHNIWQLAHNIACKARQDIQHKGARTITW
jgi:hypothetical protein